jgi:predicted metal-dependent enzyme (double-stranded beta helix superfamily)
MWALVGIYAGREDNQFYRRDGSSLVETGGRSLHVSDSILMGDDTIHAICNPLARGATAAIHVYGGDLVGAARSMWTRPDHIEEPYDDTKVVRGGIRDETSA